MAIMSFHPRTCCSHCKPQHNQHASTTMVQSALSSDSTLPADLTGDSSVIGHDDATIGLPAIEDYHPECDMVSLAAATSPINTADGIPTWTTLSNISVILNELCIEIGLSPDVFDR